MSQKTLQHPDIRKTLPVTIRQNKECPRGKCEFTISMSTALAEQLSLIAAPFLRDLCEIVVKEVDSRKTQVQCRLALESKAKILTMHGLKIIRLQRFHQGDMLELCEEYGLRYNVNPQSLLNEGKRLQHIRTKRMIRFKERHMIKLHHAGFNEKQIANAMHVPIRHVRKAIAQQPIMIGVQKHAA